MFSTQDLKEIFDSIPPTRITSTDGPASFPSLLQSASGHGLITIQSLTRQLDQVLYPESRRRSVTVLGRSLDVDDQIILGLIRSKQQLGLSEDERLILPTHEQQKLQERLQNLALGHLVHIATFAHDHDVSVASIETYVRGQAKLYLADDFICSTAYDSELSRSARAMLGDALKQVEPLELRPDSFTGSPPLSKILQILGQVVSQGDMASQIHVNEDVDVIRCIPRQRLLNSKDAAIINLQSGEMAYFNLRDIAKEHDQLYSSVQDAHEDFASRASVLVLDEFAFSEAWLSRVGEQHRQVLMDQGWVNHTASLPSELPRAMQEKLVDQLVQQNDTTLESALTPLHRFETLVLTSTEYTSKQARLRDLAKTQAINRWNTLRGSDQVPKFHISDIITAVPESEIALQAVANEKGSEEMVAGAFWHEYAKLESSNEVEFSTFWVERLLTRLHNHEKALQAINDTKFQGQLAELLAAYLTTELIPDALSRARSQGLVCSRRTRKNVQRFEASLKGAKLDLSLTMSTITKFSKKQEIAEPELAILEGAKRDLTADMIRRLQKPKTDSPLLFLTLVLVLCASYHDGVLYSTGKFAPKLLKQLKTNLSTEDYNQAERWKELAKTGSLSEEDKDSIRQMAIQRAA